MFTSKSLALVLVVSVTAVAGCSSTGQVSQLGHSGASYKDCNTFSRCNDR